MTIAKQLEIALAEVIQNHADLGGQTTIRPWQTLRFAGQFNDKNDRHFPCLDIRAGSPSVDNDQVGWHSDVIITCGTIAEDDRDHQIISDLYNEVFNVIVHLHDNSCKCGDLWQEFKSKLNGNFAIAGMTVSSGDSPADIDNLLIMTIGVTFYFAIQLEV